MQTHRLIIHYEIQIGITNLGSFTLWHMSFFQKMNYTGEVKYNSIATEALAQNFFDWILCLLLVKYFYLRGKKEYLLVVWKREKLCVCMSLLSSIKWGEKDRFSIQFKITFWLRIAKIAGWKKKSLSVEELTRWWGISRPSLIRKQESTVVNLALKSRLYP